MDQHEGDQTAERDQEHRAANDARQRPRGVDHPHSLAHPARLGELHVDAVGVRGGGRDVGEVLAALVGDYGQARLDLAQGEYRLERRVSGLWAYRVTLPVRGSYPQFRDFIGAVLKDMPIASIDALRFERKRAAETPLEAQVRVTLYARPPGETP